MRLHTVGALLGGLLLLGGTASLLAQSASPAQSPPEQSQAQKDQAPPEQSRPITEGLPKRPLSEKERKRREEAIKKELESHYKKWLDEDVVYILTPEEKTVFFELSTDEEREQFIEQFWLRRDPTPDTIENEYREEHYRRIAYANERFSSGKPGWRTDRGRIYIAWGPADQIETHPTGGGYHRSPEEGGGTTSTFPFEVWRYRYLEGVGQEVLLEFVDPTFSGEYRLTIDPSEKDALLMVPGAGLSYLEEMGIVDKTSRFDRTDGTRRPLTIQEYGNYASGRSERNYSDQFDRLQQLHAIMKPPEVKFKDLEELVTTRLSFNLLPFGVRLDFLRITGDTILVPVTVRLEKKDLTFQLKDGLHQSVVNVFGRVTTLTGRVVQTFEDVIRLDIPPAALEASLETPAVYQKAVPLRPGLYKLNLVLKDLNSGNVGTIEQKLAVPRFEDEQLAHSSLILANLIERVPVRDVGSGQFILGNTKVRPVVGEEFRQQEKMGIYLQVYNLGVDPQTFKPDAVIDYTVRRGSQTVFNYAETTADLERAGQQITLEKVLPLNTFAPGEYQLEITITDRIRKQTLKPGSTFQILPAKPDTPAQ